MSGVPDSVPGPTCFTTSALSWSGQDPHTSALDLLVGASQNPAPAGSLLQFIYVENTFYGPMTLIGTRTVSGGSVTGTWQCQPQVTELNNGCTGSGSVSGTQSGTSSGSLPSVGGAWVISTGSPGQAQATIEANLSQDASGNVTAANGQIAAIADVNGQWVFGDCLSGQSDSMEQDSFRGTINAQGQLSGTYYEGQNAWTVSATFAAPESEQHTLTGTLSPITGNTCNTPSNASLTGSTAFPTLNLSHTYTGQLIFADHGNDSVSATFQESNGTLTANFAVSGTDNGSTTLTGYTIRIGDLSVRSVQWNSVAVLGAVARHRRHKQRDHCLRSSQQLACRYDAITVCVERNRSSNCSYRRIG